MKAPKSTSHRASPNELVRYALGHEPGSQNWRWALLAALRLAGRGPGRPKKDKWDVSDFDRHGLLVMWQIQADTGETQPYTLAQKAVDTGKVPLGHAAEASVIKRLVGLWNGPIGQDARWIWDNDPF